MPTIKDRVYVGNTYAVAFDCYEPQQTTNTNAMYQSKTAKNPTSAIAELWDVQNQAFIQLGASTNSDTCVVQANTVYYTVAANKLAIAGDYKLFVTITFPDGQVVTESRTLKVQSRS